MIIEWSSGNIYQHDKRYYSFGGLIGNWSGTIIAFDRHVAHYFELVKRTTYWILTKRTTYWILNR
jgi:hypothetical protein